MLERSSLVAIAGLLAVGLGTTGASASQGVQLPGGDSLDFTPPFDITEPQVEAAPRRDRRKVKAIQRSSAVPAEQRSPGDTPFDLFGE